MKNPNILFAVCLLILAISTTTLSQSAFEYLRQALARTVYASGLQGGYEYNNNLCLAGVLLENGRSTTLKLHFRGNTNYRIIGVADEDVLDLDLFIEDSNGRVLVQDTQIDNLPVVDYTPPLSGERTIRIKNYRSTTVSFCIMVILQQRTYSSSSPPSFELLTQALDNAVTLSEVYREFSSTAFVPNTFCLFGGLYNSGESDGILNFQVPQGQGGRYVFLGAGSNNANDIDVKVINQSRQGETSGSPLCQDVDNAKTAIVSCNLSSWNYYYMQYRNYQSSGRAFVFGVIMKEGSSSGGSNFNPSPDDNLEQKSKLGNMLEYLSPVFSYSILYFGKPLFQDGTDISLRQLEISSHLYYGIRLSWGIMIPRSGNNVGYMGVLVQNFWGKFAYNLDEDQIFFPSWIAGFHWNNESPIWELAIGQIKLLEEEYATEYVGHDYYQIPINKPLKTFFVNLKCEFTIVDPVWFHLMGNYPFKNGSEYYQLGAGLSLIL